MATPSPHDSVIEAVVRQLAAVPAAELRDPARWRQTPPDAPSRAAAVRAPRRRFASIAIPAAGLATVAAVAGLTLSGESSNNEAEAALRVFTRPAIDATATRQHTPTLARAGARYSDARQIATVNGPGYVMSTAAGQVCLALPAKADGYGESCADAEEVKRRGLHVVLAGPRSGAMAAVVPTTASDALLHRSDGTERKLDIRDGVITASATGKASVSYRIGARKISVSLHGYIRCLRVPENTTSASREYLADAAKRAGIKLCAGDISR